MPLHLRAPGGNRSGRGGHHRGRTRRGLEPTHHTAGAAHIGTAASLPRVARATSTEVELARPRPSTSPADLDGACRLDVVKTPHLGRPVMPTQPASKRRAHSPSVDNPVQPNHEQRADNPAQPNARSRVPYRSCLVEPGVSWVSGSDGLVQPASSGLLEPRPGRGEVGLVLVPEAGSDHLACELTNVVASSRLGRHRVVDPAVKVHVVPAVAMPTGGSPDALDREAGLAGDPT